MLKYFPVLLILTLAACAPGQQASSTAEPAATVAPTEAPTETTVPPVYFDDFEDPNSGWFVGVDEFGEARYQDGGYLIAPPTDAGSWSSTDSPNDESFSDMRVEVDTRKAAGPDENEYGVYCRLSGEPATFYLGLIGDDGFFGIYQRTADDEWLLIDGAEDEPIEINSAGSHIRLDCIGSTISLYVNGDLVAEGSDDSLTRGEAGLYTGTLDEPGVEILFDNFAVYLP